MAGPVSHGGAPPENGETITAGRRNDVKAYEGFFGAIDLWVILKTSSSRITHSRMAVS
jgi:hypothetical protein